MQLVLRGLTWKQVLVYLDDVIVLGKDFPDALANLRMALERFREHSLKLKPRKCDLFHTETEFLGKVVNAKGISVAPSKIEAVKSWPHPKTQNEVLAFLGFLNYHRDHLKDFALMSACLYDLAHTKDLCSGRKNTKRLSYVPRLLWSQLRAYHILVPKAYLYWTLTLQINLLVQYFRKSKMGRKPLSVSQVMFS